MIGTSGSGVASSPLGALNCLRCNAYRVAIVRATRAAAAAEPPTVIRPRTSVPSIVKKRRFSFSIGDEYTPSASTDPYRFSRLVRGTRTWSNMMRPLSTRADRP